MNTALAAGTQPDSSLISFETLNFLGKMSTVNASSKAILSKLEMLEGRFIDLNTSQSLHTENHFSGEVLVLIDGGSFSATSELCAIMKRDRRAIFIGEETGGTLDGNTSGISDQITLPKSRIKIRVPLIKYVSAIGDINYEHGRGIFPDHHITPSDEKEDIVLKFALDLLGSQ